MVRGRRSSCMVMLIEVPRALLEVVIVLRRDASVAVTELARRRAVSALSSAALSPSERRAWASISPSAAAQRRQSRHGGLESLVDARRLLATEVEVRRQRAQVVGGERDEHRVDELARPVVTLVATAFHLRAGASHDVCDAFGVCSQEVAQLAGHARCECIGCEFEAVDPSTMRCGPLHPGQMAVTCGRSAHREPACAQAAVTTSWMACASARATSPTEAAASRRRWRIQSMAPRIPKGSIWTSTRTAMAADCAAETPAWASMPTSTPSRMPSPFTENGVSVATRG